MRTDREVNYMFARMCRAATEVGIDTAHWVLFPGSPPAGTAWRVFESIPGGSGLTETSLGSDFLGLTRPEAYTTLWGMARAESGRTASSGWQSRIGADVTASTGSRLRRLRCRLRGHDVTGQYWQLLQASRRGEWYMSTCHDCGATVEVFRRWKSP